VAEIGHSAEGRGHGALAQRAEVGKLGSWEVERLRSYRREAKG